ncbi:MAG: DUF4173 domain-containing protein [Lachnospiraceae bacterium]|nr:DUF4173 domain-containing protein [Lachnospiraceae bacterium]
MEENMYYKKLSISVLYAVLFTVCLYQAPHGITYPLFMIITVSVYGAMMRMLGEEVKNSSLVLMAGIVILSVHVATTGSIWLILIDKALILMLLFMLFLHNQYNDRSWDVTRYCEAMLDFTFTTFSYLPNPVTEFAAIRRRKAETEEVHGSDKKDRKESPVRYVLIGLILSIPLLLLVVPLLASSDAVFSEALLKMTRNVFEFQVDEGLLIILLMLIGMTIGAFALFTCFSKKIDRLCKEPRDERTRNPLIAITMLSVALLVYGFYCVIQIYYLFLGEGKLPEGYTYASYVHEGFYELVFVCLINLVLVLFCRKFSKDNGVLRALLAGICVCTYIMLGSSLYRMILYIEAYGLTFLRAFVLWALAVIALVMAAALALVFKASFPFVRCTAAAAVVTWAVFAFSYPDRWIAEYNIKNGYDREYTLNDLSSDAVPVIVDLWDEAAAKDVSYSAEAFERAHKKDIRKKDVRNFNLSEYRARKAMERLKESHN